MNDINFNHVSLVNWVDVGKTLREQGIDESETVLLRRKFFFSDQNIDSRDPVQLNLLYVQARDAILDGTHPVTQRKGKFPPKIKKENKYSSGNNKKCHLDASHGAVCFLHTCTQINELLFNGSNIPLFFAFPACEFAGIQVHIQFGDFIDSKHKQGFLEYVYFFCWTFGFYFCILRID